MILLLPSPQYWDYRHEPLYLAFTNHFQPCLPGKLSLILPMHLYLINNPNILFRIMALSFKAFVTVSHVS